MHEIPAFGIEARRWTVVFHRKAENRFFAVIALGRFKHVSAFAWIPELGIWTFYDVGFRRTRVTHFADGQGARQAIGAIMAGNCGVTVEARNDNLPLMRAGFFCTTAVKHLIGLRSGAIRPDSLYRHLVAHGGVVSDDLKLVRSSKVLAWSWVRCGVSQLLNAVSVAIHGDKNGRGVAE